MAAEASTGSIAPARLAEILDACGFAPAGGDALLLLERRSAAALWASSAALNYLQVSDADAAARTLFDDHGGVAHAARLRRLADDSGFRLVRMAVPERDSPVVAAWFPVINSDRPMALVHLRGVGVPAAEPVDDHVSAAPPSMPDQPELPTRVLWETDGAGRLIRIGPNADVLGARAPKAGDDLPAALRPIDAALAARVAEAAACRGSIGRVWIAWPNGDAAPLAIELGCTAGRGGTPGLRGFFAVHGRAAPEATAGVPEAEPEPSLAPMAEAPAAVEPEAEALPDAAPDVAPAPAELSAAPQGGNVVHFPVMRLGPVPANFGQDLRPAITESTPADAAADLAIPRWAEAPPPEPTPESALDGLSDDERDAFEHIRKVLGTRPFAQARPVQVVPPGVAALLDHVPLPMRLDLEGASHANPLLRERFGEEALATHLRNAPEVDTMRFDFGGMPASLLILGSDAPPASQSTVDGSEALDLVTDGYLRIDEAGVIREVSAKAGRLLGLDATAAGRAFATLLSDGQAPVWQAMAAAAAGPEAPSQGPSPLRLRHASGQPVPVAVRLARSEGGLLCALTLDRAAAPANDTAEAARREAERTSALKSEFLAKVSHEIRTPLNAILGFAEVIRDERLGPVGNARYLEYLRDIHASGTHVMSLVNDLLDLSRIEAGRMDLNLAAVDGNAIVQSCVNTLQTQAHRERVVVRLSLTPRLPPALADERSLRQIVLNLLSNAIKFNEPGGQVIVSTALSSPHAVAIRIRDTGIGMSEDEIEAAMEPFRQISTVNRTGSGLGLPLTKALVEANCASMSIKSTRGEGTLVEVTFPLVEQGSVSLPAE